MADHLELPLGHMLDDRSDELIGGHHPVMPHALVVLKPEPHRATLVPADPSVRDGGMAHVSANVPRHLSVALQF